MTFKCDEGMGNEQLGIKHVINGTLCSYIFFIGVLALGDRPVCDIPPVEILATAYITCYLPEEVIHNRSDFEVLHLRNVSNPVLVIAATWIDNKYAVYLQAGFVYDGSKEDSRIFTFQIPCVEVNHTGRYSCRPAGYDDAGIKTCELELKQNGPKPPVTQESKGIATEDNTYDHMSIINTVFLCVNIAFIPVLVVVLAKNPEKLEPLRNWLKKIGCIKRDVNKETRDGNKILLQKTPKTNEIRHELH